MVQQQESILYFEDLKKIIPQLNRTSLWRWMRSGKFPKSRQLGPRRVCWLESEIQTFIKSLASSRKIEVS